MPEAHSGPSTTARSQRGVESHSAPEGKFQEVESRQMAAGHEGAVVPSEEVGRGGIAHKGREAEVAAEGRNKHWVHVALRG